MPNAATIATAANKIFVFIALEAKQYSI
jgi:hypothetical protein